MDAVRLKLRHLLLPKPSQISFLFETILGDGVSETGAEPFWPVSRVCRAGSRPRPFEPSTQIPDREED